MIKYEMTTFKVEAVKVETCPDKYFVYYTLFCEFLYLR